MVRRYMEVQNDGVYEEAFGEYVEYVDYEKLQKELEDVKKQRLLNADLVKLENEDLKKGLRDIKTMIEINETYTKKWCIDDIDKLLESSE